MLRIGDVRDPTATFVPVYARAEPALADSGVDELLALRFRKIGSRLDCFQEVLLPDLLDGVLVACEVVGRAGRPVEHLLQLGTDQERQLEHERPGDLRQVEILHPVAVGA